MLEDHCGMLIKKINDALSKDANNRLKNENLTTTQIGMLMILSEKGDGSLSMKELEKELHVAQPTVVGIVSRLEQKGYVCSFGDPNDKRIKIVQITENGRKQCENAYSVMEDTERMLMSGMTSDERKQLIRLLNKVYFNLE
ncbi:MAG: MarR family transcriptional regulator [Clostridia bacterium]|nr:MarR family transcriptional regulator [Clostridia bacterium]